MNKKEFSVYLHKPQLIDKHAEIAIQEVVTDFPYFHAAHQLLLKAHQNNGSYHFEKQLPVVSLLHGNRALLYEYLKHTLVKEFHQVAAEDPVSTNDSLIEIQNAGIENLFNFKETALEVSDVIESDHQEAIVSTEVVKEPYISNEVITNPIIEESIDLPEIIVTEEEPVIAFLPVSDNDLPFQNFQEKYLEKVESPLPSNIMAPEVSINNEAPDAETNTEEKLQVAEIESPQPIETNTLASEIEEIEEPEAVKVELEVTETKVEKTATAPLTKEEVKVISTIQPDDFLAWLQSKKQTAHKEQPVHTNTKNIDVETPVNSFETKIEEVPTFKSAEEKRIKKFNALIDKFIENSPSISKPQPSKFYNPAEKAKESVTENFDLVTETLAKIYIKQSNYKKAIMVYEKLSLLYPEKISYFAAQISELQILLNK